MDSDKRRDEMAPEQVQRGNLAWWTRNVMSYDWSRPIAHARLSPEWFDAVDARFVHDSRLYASERVPFDRVIPFERLSGARVLEIGCGLGLHSELMARAGARVISADLSPAAAEATRTRFRLKGLEARVVRVDAESLPFERAAFDFVWSWGVIHHSSRTARIVREIARVLRPGGGCRIMVYNREGMAARVAFLRDHLLKGGFLTRSWEETLHASTDGFSARHYVPEQFEDLFRAFFARVSSQVCGQDADAVPLPGRLRSLAVSVLPESWLQRAQARRGSFILLEASEPG